MPAAAAASHRSHLLQPPLTPCASLCRHPAGCTLEVSGQSFWSRTGSQSSEAVEFLLYKMRCAVVDCCGVCVCACACVCSCGWSMLAAAPGPVLRLCSCAQRAATAASAPLPRTPRRSPLCLVRSVQLIVFRAHYQVDGWAGARLLLKGLRCANWADGDWPAGRLGRPAALSSSVAPCSAHACLALPCTPTHRPQFGEPVYPPLHVSFQAGPTPWGLAPPTIKYPVAATGGAGQAGWVGTAAAPTLQGALPAHLCRPPPLRRRCGPVLPAASRPACGALPPCQLAWQAAAAARGHAGAWRGGGACWGQGVALVLLSTPVDPPTQAGLRSPHLAPARPPAVVPCDSACRGVWAPAVSRRGGALSRLAGAAAGPGASPGSCACLPGVRAVAARATRAAAAGRCNERQREKLNVGLS